MVYINILIKGMFHCSVEPNIHLNIHLAHEVILFLTHAVICLWEKVALSHGKCISKESCVLDIDRTCLFPQHPAAKICSNSTKYLFTYLLPDIRTR